jgi:uncharacterized protein YndB with AHSA1/START domain
MKWILWSIVALVGVVGVIALIGFLLPVEHQASRSAEIQKPPEVVFALLSDLNHYQSWWPAATVKSEVVESRPPNRIVTRVIGETQFGGTWTIDITAVPSGSLVTITERGQIYNVVFRTLSKFVFGYTRTIDGCLAAAQRKLSD